MAINTSADLQQTLSKLKDIHLPTDSLWWPPAPGIILLTALSLLIICTFCYLLIKNIHYRLQHRPIKLAMAQLQSINARRENSDPLTSARDISLLLKRCAIAKYGNINPEVRSLTGRPWLEFLNQSGQTEQFTSEIGQLIITLPYLDYIDYTKYDQKQLQGYIKQLCDLAKHWISKNL